jgi:hypothetical protein
LAVVEEGAKVESFSSVPHSDSLSAVSEGASATLDFGEQYIRVEATEVEGC